MDVETFYNGILAAIVVPEGKSAPVGAAIGILAENEEELDEAKGQAASISTTSSASSPATSTQALVTPTHPPATSSPAPALEHPPKVPAAAPSGPKKIVATPFAKKLAKQHKVDINSVVGTGPYGRITAADVESAAGIAPSKKSAGPAVPAAERVVAPPKAAAPALPPTLPGSTVVPFSTMQSVVSKNMLESLSVPTFRVGYPVSTDALDALYEKVKPKGVTMTALLAKAAAMTLVQHPVVNATCKDGKSFTYNSSINIAVAVAINGVLKTPVL